jgi:hypothetical protein
MAPMKDSRGDGSFTTGVQGSRTRITLGQSALFEQGLPGVVPTRTGRRPLLWDGARGRRPLQRHHERHHPADDEGHLVLAGVDMKSACDWSRSCEITRSDPPSGRAYVAEAEEQSAERERVVCWSVVASSGSARWSLSGSELTGERVLEAGSVEDLALRGAQRKPDLR